uniref:Fhb7-M10 n=1 Tax=Thinopyrum elongatum TaxID=4588 RepID=UPI0030131EB5
GSMATSTSTSTPIIFYDIAQRPPVAETCCAPNPWKSRLALNFKAVPYTTTWVKLPDIERVCKEIGAEPSAFGLLKEGKPYYTLPIIHDPATDSLIGDSFDIAAYLQRTYPASGAGDLFPPQKLDYAVGRDMQQLLFPLSEIRASPELADYARFNSNVDAAFTAHVGLMVHGLPLDPATAEVTKAEFVRRAGLSSWDDLEMVGEARDKMMQSFRNMLGDLAALFRKDASGPFLLGQRATYADMIVGGWLRMMRATLPVSEWQEARAWHGGIFGRLHDALDKYAEVK